VLPGVVRHTFIIFGLLTTPNLCPPWHKILATPLCLWVTGSAKNSSLSQHQSCLSGNWLIFIDEMQNERILITRVSLVL